MSEMCHKVEGLYNIYLVFWKSFAFFLTICIFYQNSHKSDEVEKHLKMSNKFYGNFVVLLSVKSGFLLFQLRSWGYKFFDTKNRNKNKKGVSLMTFHLCKSLKQTCYNIPYNPSKSLLVFFIHSSKTFKWK